MLQAVVRERRTINYTAKVGGLRGRRDVWKMVKLKYKKLREDGCTMEGGVAQHNMKVTIGVTIHDLIDRIQLGGVGWWH